MKTAFNPETEKKKSMNDAITPFTLAVPVRASYKAAILGQH
jgi:hypothetical protein